MEPEGITCNREPRAFSEIPPRTVQSDGAAMTITGKRAWQETPAFNQHRFIGVAGRGISRPYAQYLVNERPT